MRWDGDRWKWEEGLGWEEEGLEEWEGDGWK